MTERHLRAVDGNGEIAEDVTPIPSEVACLVEELVEARRKISALKGELTKLHEVDPDAETIGGLLEYWQGACKHPRAQIPIDGERAVTIKRTLKLYPPETIRLVIDVVAAQPWMGEFGQRYCEPGPGRKRKDDPTTFLRNEVTIERLLAVALDEKHAEDHETYRAWLHGECKAKPGLVRALAFLAERPPHGSVIAAAAIWAKQQEAR